jgi:hypothetical protein
MEFMKTNLRFLRIVDRERYLLEVGQIYGQFVAILTTVHWPQVAQGNTRYIPSRYIVHTTYTIYYYILVIGDHLATIAGVQFQVLDLGQF